MLSAQGRFPLGKWGCCVFHHYAPVKAAGMFTRALESVPDREGVGSGAGHTKSEQQRVDRHL